MRHIVPLLLILGALPPMTATEDTVEQLMQDIEQTRKERDLAQKEFLNLQQKTETRIQDLSATQDDLNRQLKEADLSMLELQAEATRSAAAADQARLDLEAREKELADLQAEVSPTRARVAELEVLPPTQRRDFLVEEMQRRLGKQLLEISHAEYGKRQAVADLAEFQKLNQELRTTLRSTRRQESLSAAKLSALESRLGKLNQEVSTLSRERDELQEDQKRLNGVVQDLKTRLTEAEKNEYTQEHVTALEETLQAARNEVRQLAEELEARKAIPDLREAFAAMERERDELQAKQETLYAKLEELEKTLAKEQQTHAEERKTLTAKAEKFQQELRAEQMTRLEQEKALTAKVEELEVALQQEQRTWEQEERLMASQVDRLETQLKRQRTGSTNTEQQLAREIQRLELALKKKPSERTNAEKDLVREIQRLEQALEEKQSGQSTADKDLALEVKRLERALKQEQSGRNDQEKAIASRVNKLKQALQEEREGYEEQQAALNEKVEQLNASLRKERAERIDEQELRRGLEVELGRERKTNRDLQRQIRRLEAGLNAATRAGVEEAELAEVNMLVEELRQENERLQAESLKARGDVDVLMSELNDKGSRQGMQIRELQTMLGEQMIELTEAQRKIEALEAKTVSYDRLKEERNDLISKRDKARRDMKVLAKHIYDLRTQVAENQQMASRLASSTEDRERLRQEVARQERLTNALREEQERKDRQILDLMKRLAAERPAPAPSTESKEP